MRRSVLSVVLTCLLGIADGADWLRGEFTPIDQARELKPKRALCVPRVQNAPSIDGVLNDAVWAKAARIGRLPASTSRVKGHTEVRLAADRTTLFVGFKCSEPEMHRLRTDVKPTDKRTNAVWNDDAVEVLVDPTGDAKVFCYLVMNAASAMFSAEYGGRGAKWQPEIECKAHVDEAFWSAELALPLEIYGLDGSQANLPMRMQFCRLAPARKEKSYWQPGGSDPQHFGSVLVDRRGDVPTIEQLSLGNFCLGTNALRIRLSGFPQGRYAAKLVLNDESTPTRLQSAGGTDAVSAPYELRAETRRVQAELTVVREDVTPAKVIESHRGEFLVPCGLAVCFRNAHIAERGSTRMWVRSLLGDAVPAKLRATVVDRRGKPVRSVPLPTVPQNAGEAWFDFDATGFTPGQYGMRVECDRPKVSATAMFWVERVTVPVEARVPVFVDEPVGRDWSDFPVSVGVPFPRGVLDSVGRVRIVDQQGIEVPSQVKLTSTWNPDGRDVRWLLADFLASSTRGAGARYALEYGQEAARAAVPNAVQVAASEKAVIVDTGAVRFVVDRTRGTILKEIQRNGKTIVAGDGGGVYLQNQDRKVFCSAWDRDPPRVDVELRGPIRAVIRQSGWYAAREGERLCRYDIRIHAFAGQPYLEILHTWILTHDSRTVQFGDISIRFPLAGSATRCAFGVDDQYSEPPWEGPLAADEMSCLVQEDSDRFQIRTWQDGSPTNATTGRFGGGWAGAWTADASILAHLRDMWQMYPAELEVTPNALAVHFWPEHGFSFTFRERPDRYGVHRWPYTDGPFMNLQPREYTEEVLMKDKEKIKAYDRINALGLSRTQEIWLDIGSADRTADAMQERARKYELPLSAKAESQWIGDTGVFRPFLAKDEKTYPRIEEYLRARWESTSYLMDRCHDYGWLHYGDRHGGGGGYPLGPNAKFKTVHRYWLVSDYRAGMEPWLLWARSGERLYHEWAERLSRHVMDVDTIHWSSEDVYPSRRRGYFYPMSFAHYCSFASSMTLHNEPVGYNMMYYYLTGYRRALDVLLMCGEAEFEQDLGRSRMHRGIAVTGHNQLDLHRITWDERHWESAFKAINTGLDAMLDKSYLDPTYVWEWCYDIGNFTGDSRLRTAVLNIADNIVGKPLGTLGSYPALYVLGHAYALTGDPKYIAWGKGKLEMHVSNINISDDEELRGRVTNGDSVHFTRLMRQVPGYLHYQKEAEELHGPIKRRTQPFRCIYERGPVYFREDDDQDWYVRVYLGFHPEAKSTGHLRLFAPDGKLVVEKPVNAAELPVSDMNKCRGWQDEHLRLRAPKDDQTGVYRLDIDVETEGGRVQGHWGIESPTVRKIAYQLSHFTFFGGHAFFHVPRDTQSFRIRVVPRTFRNAYGQPVLLRPDGSEHLRLPHGNREWIEIKPRPEDTGGLWVLVLFEIGVLELDGVPGFVYADPSEFFLPGGGIAP